MTRSSFAVLIVALSFVSFVFLGVGDASAQGRSSNMQDLALSSDQPIEIESKQMDVDEANGQATFTGNVKVVQGQTTLAASKMIVYFAQGASLTSGASEFDKIDLFGGVNMQSKEQSATADRGTINMKTQMIVLSGKEVVLTEGDSVFLGCKLTVNMTDGDARLESCGDPIKLLINPKSRPE